VEITVGVLQGFLSETETGHLTFPYRDFSK
jgi:hypothetical protein